MIRSGFRHWAALWTIAAVLCVAGGARAGDPYLRWYTIETPHFRIHYHSGLELVAQKTASIGENIHRRLVPQLGWEPSEVTEIVISDPTDGANGSANAIPYNTVRMFASAPDDMSPLGDYEDWVLELLTHEYSHVLHVDNITGIPALLNTILGKRYAPNQTQPRWILEGLAVVMESEHTAGGRLRSSQFDMYLRSDVLEDNLATLDEISNPARRWPGGNVWYLYGAKFIEWIADLYGPETFAAVAADYGNNIIPWGVNRSIRRATGRTYTELYQGWRAYLERRYTEQIAEVRRRGLRQGVRLTSHGWNASSPRFVPPCARSGKRDELVYFRDDGHDTAGIYRLPLDSPLSADQSAAEIIARSSGHIAAFDAECGLVFDGTAPSRRQYFLNDLFRQPPGTSSPRGIEKSRQRLTIGRRARDPDVSPDGRRVAYVTNRAGTSTLRIAELTPEHAIKRERRVVPSAHWEQAYTPRFSPDGRRIAYAAWTKGGMRDVRIVDVESGRFQQITHDRAVDQQPTWSADGRFLLFVSDRTGIANVYAYEIATRKLHQVTNVTTGAYMPELSPDGRTLVYVGYTSEGFDLYAMPFDRAQFLPALPFRDERPHVHSEPSISRFKVKPYNPLPTLRPRAYELEYFSNAGSFGGDAVQVITTGNDAVGHHAFAAILTLDLEQPSEPAASLDYVYGRLPFDFRMTFFRSARPSFDVVYANPAPLTIERQTGLSTGVSYGIPGEFDSQVISLSYTASEFHGDLPIGPSIDPYAQRISEPFRGFVTSLHLGYAYSNAEGSIWAISTEKGFSISLGADIADEALGGEGSFTSLVGTATAYVPMPWLRHHVLALAVQAATAGGSVAGGGFYGLGGLTPQSVGEVVDAFETGLRQSSFVLRGYKPGAFAGSQLNLFKAEYRFPILYVDRGLSTLPAFLRGVSGALFADYGGAYNEMDLEDPLQVYHLGVGGELWLDLVLGYFAYGSVRFGIAKGIDELDPPLQTYMVMSAGF